MKIVTVSRKLTTKTKEIHKFDKSENRNKFHKQKKILCPKEEEISYDEGDGYDRPRGVLFMEVLED